MKASKTLTHRHVAQLTKAIILCEMLEALTRLAITYETAVVGKRLSNCSLERRLRGRGV
jgi:hypothetical protein